VTHHSRTAAFRRLVRDHMASPPPLLDRAADCGELVRLMRDTPASSALITAPGRGVTGIVTEQDVVRRIAYRCTPQTPLERLATAPVRTVREDDYLYHAIATMRRQQLRHMPVVDDAGQVTGLLHLDEALVVAASPLMEQIDRLTHEETLEGLRQVRAAQVDVARELLEEQVPAPEIQALLTQINNDIHRRVLELHLRDLEHSHWGPPPRGFCTLVMGSGGRGENFLSPDQDNGFIVEDYPDARHRQIDAYFIELALRLSRTLDDVGIRTCRGHVMATNPLWRKTLSQWHHQLRYWLEHATPRTLRLADIFFDFSAVFGDQALARALRSTITRTLPTQYGFLREMQRIQDEHGVALGLFGRLTPDPNPRPHKGALNLKHHGLVPLIEALRLLALREGIPATATLERIDALSSKGLLSRDEREYLSNALHHLGRLILRQQIEDFSAGREVSAYVPPAALSAIEMEHLKDALHAIKDLKERVRIEFTAQIF